MTEKKRNLNLDLIRCLALFLVPCIHGLDNTGLYSIALTTAADKAMVGVKLIVTNCIPLYLLLSGYLCCRKRLSARYYLGYVRIYLVYLLCAVPCVLLEYFYEHSLHSLSDIIGSVINFYCCGYAWYIMMYAGLFLMIPFLNLIYQGCATQRQKQLLIATFFALSILPSLLNSYVHLYSLWWEKLYPLCYYFTGAYLRDYMPKVKPSRIFAGAAAFIVGYGVFFFYTRHGEGAALCDLYQTSWSIYLLSCLLFIGLFNLRLDRIPRKLAALLSRVSDLALPAFLLTWVPDGLLYPVMVRIAPAVHDRYIWLLATVPISFFSALLMALVVDWVFRPLHRWLMARLTRLLPEEQA